MADQSAELVRAGRCACTVDESRLTGREIAGLCDGERYIPYSTMYAHYKALKKRMAKKGKHDITRPKIEMVPRHVVCFTHDPCNWRQGIPQAQTLEASNEDIYCDDNGDYGGDDAWHGGGGESPLVTQTGYLSGVKHEMKSVVPIVALMGRHQKIKKEKRVRKRRILH
jgi:hypothetical protein